MHKNPLPPLSVNLQLQLTLGKMLWMITKQCHLWTFRFRQILYINTTLSLTQLPPYLHLAGMGLHIGPGRDEDLSIWLMNERRTPIVCRVGQQILRGQTKHPKQTNCYAIYHYFSDCQTHLYTKFHSTIHTLQLSHFATFCVLSILACFRCSTATISTICWPLLTVKHQACIIYIVSFFSVVE